MPKDRKPNVPNAKQDFNKAAQPAPPNIATKQEYQARQAKHKELQAKIANTPPAPKPEIGRGASAEIQRQEFAKNKKALEENQQSMDQIKRRLEQKQLKREFNRVATRKQKVD